MSLWPIYILLVLAGFLLRKSSRILDAFVICFLVFLACTNATHADYPAYSNWYYIGYLANPDTYDSGWYLICMLGHRIGLAYNGVVGLMTALATILLFAALVRLRVNRSFFWALFLVFPALVNIVQIRQYLAISLVMLGFAFMLDRRFRGYLVFVACVLLATAFHRTAAVFVLLPAVFLLERLRPAALLAMALALVALSSMAIVLPDILIAPVFGDFMVEKYFSEIAWNTASAHIHDRIVWGSLLVLALVPLTAAYLHRANAQANAPESKQARNLLRFATCLSVLGLCVIPLTFMSADVLRMHRYVYLFAILGFSSLLALPGSSTRERLVWKTPPLLFAILESLALVNATGDFGWVTNALLTFTTFPPLFVA